MKNFQVRTDLALEAREGMMKNVGKLRGVLVEEHEYEVEKIHVTKVVIDTKNASGILGKPMGIYVTMETPTLPEPDEGTHRKISECFAKELMEMIPNREKEQEILVVGLGNREVTADALGPLVVDQLLVTRHMLKMYGKVAYSAEKVNAISSIEPGVMAKTGMETLEIIKGIVEQTKPDLILVVDALAARSTKRLHRTIQITNTGIQPGSGVGNHRNALTKEELNVPVIAVGIPTVVDAATIVKDALDKMIEGCEVCEGVKYREKLNVDLLEYNDMYMTGKDIDAVIKRISYTISEGINIAMERVFERE